MTEGSAYAVGLCSAAQLRAELRAFAALLQDAVDDGASVGFLPPLSEADAGQYWETVIAAVAGGTRYLFVARADGLVAGSVQLDLPAMPNARHRGEVMKLLVHRRARGRGLGRGLMQALERQAAVLNRTLLVLDTRRGDPAEQLYASLGYRPAGVIPRYAMSARGTLEDTVYMYREVAPRTSGADDQRVTR